MPDITQAQNPPTPAVDATPAQQEQLGRLATLGEITGGIAHDLNNKLNNISLFIGNVIDMLELDKLDHELSLQHLHNATQQIYQATEIVEHLRNFVRETATTPQPLNLHRLIQQTLGLLQE